MDNAPHQLNQEYPLNIDPSTQEKLLEVQAKDTEIAQLVHRKGSLPEIERKAELETQLTRARNQHVAAEVILGDLQRDQARSDADVEVVRQRIIKDQQMLDSGTINDPKQLSALQHELESLARRRTELEDLELEIMERVEGAEAAVSVLAGQITTLSGELEQVSTTLQDLTDTLSADIAEVEKERAALALALPSDFMSLYEKIRGSHSGVGAALLHRGQCGGCRLTIPPQEMQIIKVAPIETVVQCEECRRILIRTSESGI
jgi:predicted  nucleic acid-binding Zn-ribbon protein